MFDKIWWHNLLETVPADCIADLFQKDGVDLGVAGGLVADGAASLVAILSALPRDSAMRISAQAKAIFALADGTGADLILEQIELLEPTSFGECAAFKSPPERAVWLQRKFGRLSGGPFESSLAIAHALCMYFAPQDRMAGPRDQRLSHTPHSLEAFGAALVSQNQNSGGTRTAVVRHFYRRHSDAHYYMIWDVDEGCSQGSAGGPARYKALLDPPATALSTFRNAECSR